MHARYLRFLLLFCALTWLPAIVLNFVLVKNEGNIEEISFAASAWQEKTKGITFSPTFGNNSLFKTLRLNDRLAETDTIVFSSSTSMPIDSTMLPSHWHLYNFSQSGSPLSSSIRQAEYLAAKAPHIKHYIIALDWAIGSPYQAVAAGPIDLTRPTKNTANQQKNCPSLLADINDALSFPRMTKLWQVLTNIAKARQPTRSFREHFLQISSDEYLCPDGKTPGMDFGVHNRGTCNGFRYDGSATYSDYKLASNEKTLINVALSASSKYVEALKTTQGAVHPQVLERLSALNTAIGKNGGTLILIMPPLSPGLEKGFLQHPQYSTYLQRTKQDFEAWNKTNRAVILDFGQSEKYGCAVNEFLDQHHAIPSCYQKTFDIFWKSAEGSAIIARTRER
ncbi:MAG: hypothetical protein BWY57_00756 [Betaproteobacteria bacterium ADurb.Bin341]|nr:MAG: hypothetical protein BWY57_00756 [Betaproteobacteria bacterium ADurb.Bin341]